MTGWGSNEKVADVNLDGGLVDGCDKLNLDRPVEHSVEEALKENGLIGDLLLSSFEERGFNTLDWPEFLRAS